MQLVSLQCFPVGALQLPNSRVISITSDSLPMPIAERDWTFATCLLESYALAFFSQLRRRHPKLNGKISPSEVIQETLLRASQKDHGTRGDPLFGAWLKGIFDHVVLDELKKWRRQMRNVFDEHSLELLVRDGSRVLEPMLADDHPPEEEVLRREQLQQVHSALAKLTLESRELLVNFYFGNWSVQELADDAACSNDAMKHRLRVARTELSRHLLPIMSE